MNNLNQLKQKALLLLLLVAAGAAKAQEYIPIVAEGKRWNVMLSDCWFPPEPQKHTTTSYKIEGDTLLENVVYKKMFATKHEDLTRWWLHGLIRENEAKQVFYRQWGGGQLDSEKLIYDFSMLPGDSILVWPWQEEYLFLQRISDTVLEDGNIRKKYSFNYNDDFCYGCTEFWIEGVGSQWGYPGDAYLLGGSNRLLCSFENEELVWHDPYFGECFYTNWDWDEIGEYEKKDEIVLYPNPVKEQVFLGNALREVELFNAFGQLMYKGTTNMIDVRDWPNGMYFIRVTDEKGVVGTAKLVKQ